MTLRPNIGCAKGSRSVSYTHLEQKQVPWEDSSLTGRFYFIAPENPATPVARVPAAGAPEVSAPQSDTSSGSGWLSRLFNWNTPTAASTTPAPAANTPNTVTSGSSASGDVAGPKVSAGATISGANVLALFNTLGIQAQNIDAAQRYSPASVRQLLETSARSVSLGSTSEELRAALELCRQYSAHCDPAWYCLLYTSRCV